MDDEAIDWNELLICGALLVAAMAAIAVYDATAPRVTHSYVWWRPADAYAKEAHRE